MLARLDLAQPSLDTMRSIWTGIALGELAACGNYPPRPTQINIANPILAANYPNLEPLRTLFNDAMLNVHHAVDLWVEVCSRPQPVRGVVGQATVSGAMGIVNLADEQFAELRRRINALLPPEIELGPNQCLFTFQNASEVIDLLPLAQIGRGTLDASKRAYGFCFDATTGQQLRFESLQVSGNARLRISVSPFDNPTAFIANGITTSTGGNLSVGPVLISTSGRYLLLISHDDPTLSEPLVSDFAVLITDTTGVTIVGPGLILDPTTGQPAIASPNLPNILTPLAVTATPNVTTAVVCPSLTFTCDMFTSCAEAEACYALGLTRLDADGDGVPCDLLCQAGGG